ncbi:cytochrome c-type biogenesis protein [Sedimenticola hydrogenitrophicus]|uniref:cytochrome c-type biogenesis protein n=1 Tax=Sedimenticola hydrogenitrophicus TaxID=2967975 RepID=UPI0021A4D1A8|nr:cytochrome c-type biogenesis protein [Sedimenticola hydrogenitrophicus]
MTRVLNLRRCRTLLLLWLLSASALTPAANHPADLYPFDDSARAARFWQLTTQLRCLVCQNQNIAESNADLAKDMRDALYRQLLAGASDDEIIDFMVSRYGDFVLFKPPFKGSTLLLWVGPFLLGALGVGALWWMVAGIARRPEDGELTDEEQVRLKRLINETHGGTS